MLLLEEVGEAPCRIGRMMRQFARSGMLEGIRALLVGHFTDIKDPEKFCAGGVCEVIDACAGPLGIPVVYGFPSGHDEPNLSLYMGRRVRVAVGERGAFAEFLPDTVQEKGFSGLSEFSVSEPAVPQAIEQ